MAKNDKPLHWATRPFDYGSLSLDRGQIFDMTGARNDEKLLRLGYVEVYDGGRDALAQCSECGALFVGHNMRIGHHEKRHAQRHLTPDEQDRLAEREERMLEKVAPIKFDQTEASRA